MQLTPKLDFRSPLEITGIRASLSFRRTFEISLEPKNTFNSNLRLYTHTYLLTAGQRTMERA